MIRFSVLPCLLLASIGYSQVKLPDNHKLPAPKPTAAIGKEHGKTITAADIEPYLWEWYGKDALYDVMSFLAITQDAANRGIVISDAEVEKGIDTALQSVRQAGSQSGMAPPDIAGEGFPRSRLYMRVKANLLMDKIILSDFHQENFVKVSTILIRTPSADASAIADAIKNCQSAYDELIGGKDWNSVFTSVTSDPNLMKSKGQLGWRSMDLFPDPVQKEITTLQVGGYTHPAQTQYGIQLFRVDALGADAKGDDLQTLKNGYLAASRSRYMADLKSRANIQVLLK